MSENFDYKDYSQYFAKLESDLKKQSLKDSLPESTDFLSSSKEKKTQKGKTFSLKADVIKRAGTIPALFLLPSVLVILITAVVLVSVFGKSKPKTKETFNASSQAKSVLNEEEESETFDYSSLFAEQTESTKTVPASVKSKSVIFINTKDNTVVAQKNAEKRWYPASTTKIMTLLVAVENMTDVNDTFTFSYEITDPFYRQQATMAGFANGEKVNMTDLLYGAILPSGADATAAIALKIAGSEEGFVKLMNDKAAELGLENTNFTNCSGLFDKNHYTTAKDMSVILRAAMNNETCKKILSTYKYITAKTPQHPKGIELTSTLFSYMYGTEPEGSDILGGKTGYVGESGYCIASFGESESKTEYVCIAFGAPTRWPAIYDQIELYTIFAKK